jgi:Lar family restriction alleviation protein
MVKKSKPKLTPCPFCGEVNMQLERPPFSEFDHDWFAQCKNCGATATSSGTEADVVKAWNRRAKMAKKSKEERRVFWIARDKKTKEFVYVIASSGNWIKAEILETEEVDTYRYLISRELWGRLR